MDNLITAILTLGIFIGIIVIIYILSYNNLQAYRIKINEAESIIDELLRKKYDCLIQFKSIILENTTLSEKNFDELKKIKDINISSFDFERKLTEVNSLVDKIRVDHPKLEDNEAFNNACEDIYNINEKLEASKTFYNKYTNLLNKYIKKFPSNIIARFHHITLKNFFDGKNMFDDDINDFKL